MHTVETCPRSIAAPTLVVARSQPYGAAALGSPLLLTLLAVATPSSAARIPQPVSPGAESTGMVVEARCPTFSWAGVPGASAYEIAVFRVAAATAESANAEPVLVSRATVPGDARAYTPPVGRCLDRGQRYGWSVAAVGADRRGAGAVEAPQNAGRALTWSPAFLFDVEVSPPAGTPSSDELERALDTLERYLEAQGSGRSPAGTSASERRRPSAAGSASDAGARRETAIADRPRVERADRARRVADALPGPLTSPTTSDVATPRVVRRVSTPATPTIDDASLSLSGQIHLTDASAVFKEADVFLWDDSVGNLALGRDAIASATNYAHRNTAVGRRALQFPQGSDSEPFAFFGSLNSAVGYEALTSNTFGYFNTAMGAGALRFNTGGNGNTAMGTYSLANSISGDFNTALGVGALATSNGFENTATGAYALGNNTTGNFNTASGTNALGSNAFGDQNTAIGSSALADNNVGDENTAIGASALAESEGDENTAIGAHALGSTDGDGNIALGYRAGFANTTGEHGIFIGNEGDASDDQNIKIGTAGLHIRTFIAGIRGVTTSPADAIQVLISSTGQLGTTSSSRALKRDVQDLGGLADRLLDLHPVAFRFRQHVEANPETPLEFGLIAEEVAEVFPELVVFDQNGEPMSVKYHLLSSLLLGALQEQRAALGRQETIAAEQQARLERHERLAAEQRQTTLLQEAELRRLARAIEGER